MKILQIALFAASIATTPAAAFADGAPEGHSQPQIASYSQPEGQTQPQIASYSQPEGHSQPQIASYTAPEGQTQPQIG
jgi:hypothetical protein